MTRYKVAIRNVGVYAFPTKQKRTLFIRDIKRKFPKSEIAVGV